MILSSLQQLRANPAAHRHYPAVGTAYFLTAPYVRVVIVPRIIRQTGRMEKPRGVTVEWTWQSASERPTHLDSEVEVRASQCLVASS